MCLLLFLGENIQPDDALRIRRDVFHFIRPWTLWCDLRPDDSFIRWAVREGHTDFVISWINPDERLAARTQSPLPASPPARLRNSDRQGGACSNRRDRRADACTAHSRCLREQTQGQRDSRDRASFSYDNATCAGAPCRSLSKYRPVWWRVASL